MIGYWSTIKDVTFVLMLMINDQWKLLFWLIVLNYTIPIVGH